MVSLHSNKTLTKTLSQRKKQKQKNPSSHKTTRKSGTLWKTTPHIIIEERKKTQGWDSRIGLLEDTRIGGMQIGGGDLTSQGQCLVGSWMPDWSVWGLKLYPEIHRHWIPSEPLPSHSQKLWACVPLLEISVLVLLSAKSWKDGVILALRHNHMLDSMFHASAICLSS